MLSITGSQIFGVMHPIDGKILVHPKYMHINLQIQLF